MPIAVWPRRYREPDAYRVDPVELEYESEFLERAVFLCTRRREPAVPVAQVTRFHWERERAYQVLDPEERERRFFEIHLAWFREWGLEWAWRRFWAEHWDLETRLQRLLLCRPRPGLDPGADLYVDAEGKASLVLALSPEMLVSGRGLEAFLRHEFLHVRDMLAPDFGYEPGLTVAGLPPGFERLVRERYRLLWDVSIDGRLAAAGYPGLASRTDHAAALARGFPFWSEQRREEILQRLWSGVSPRHADLLGWAADPREVRRQSAPVPGAPCPLCGFPTFDWAPEVQIRAVEAAVRREFPWWRPEAGLCGRCGEVYGVRPRPECGERMA